MAKRKTAARRTSKATTKAAGKSGARKAARTSAGKSAARKGGAGTRTPAKTAKKTGRTAAKGSSKAASAKKTARTSSRKGAKATARKAANTRKTATKASGRPSRGATPAAARGAKGATPTTGAAARKAAKRPRPAQVPPDPIRGAIPSSLDPNRRGASSARSGREELLQHIEEITETSPAITAGDVDADWQQAYSSGDEAPGGTNPTPDQDVVDEIGEALGVSYEDGEELKGAAKIEARDKHRWELDPASKDDFEDS